MAIVRVMNSVMCGSATAKDKFREKVSYSRFVDALKSLGQPSQELLSTLLDLVSGWKLNSFGSEQISLDTGGDQWNLVSRSLLHF